MKVKTFWCHKSNGMPRVFMILDQEVNELVKYSKEEIEIVSVTDSTVLDEHDNKILVRHVIYNSK